MAPSIPESRINWECSCDFIVVGAGVAGLTAAVDARDFGLRVLVVDKGTWTQGAREVVTYPESATRLAQGGVAVVGLHDENFTGSADDQVKMHIEDTLDAGAGLCDLSAVTQIINDGGAAVEHAISRGVRFDTAGDGTFLRTREGGHRVRRIVHAGGDASGEEIQRALEDSASGLPCLQNATVLSVLTDDRGTSGLLVVDPRGLGLIHAPAVLLATGGNGQLFEVTTAPNAARGDGLALALRAGATLADLEFTQFHPTVLFDSEQTGRRPLISEAVRGEGAMLISKSGHRLMKGIDDRLDLAPRDIIARAIALHLKESGDRNVFLDARHIESFPQRFPTVTAGCQTAEIDPQRDLIPVAPAAHYQCGGIVVDALARTSVPGLLAAGEVARTGLHGANRLASNSLLEGLVCGRRAARSAAMRVEERPHVQAVAPRLNTLNLNTLNLGAENLSIQPLSAQSLNTQHLIGEQFGSRVHALDHPTPHKVTPLRQQLQRMMSAYVGVTRDSDGLERVLLIAGSLAGFSADLGESQNDLHGTSFLPRGVHQLRADVVSLLLDDALSLCRIMAMSAQERRETRGGHTRLDYPKCDPRQRHSTYVTLSENGDPVLSTNPAIADGH